MGKRPTGDFTLPPGTALGPVALTVADRARGLRFYQETLGLRLLERRDDALALGADGTPLVILRALAGARPKPRNTTGLYHFAILLPARADLARTLRRLIQEEYPLQGAADHGVSEALYLADPDGNGIEVYVDRPRAAWPRRGDQLHMVTDPLDVDGLLAELERAEAGDSSLPTGTRIGHVHLQVSDLAPAAAFYRDLLGFELTQRYGPSARFLSAGGYHHHVGLNTWAGVGTSPPPPDAVGLRYFTLYVPDEGTLARLTERLQAAEVPLERFTDGLLFHDPSGNGIRLATRPEERDHGPTI